MAAPVVIAEVVRSGFVEGHHYGSWVVLDPDGSVRASAGDATGPILPRSCNKPLQALAMVEAGLPLTDELLALACASHSGEPFHIEGVRRILETAGLTEDALQTPPDWPIDDDEREKLIRDGGSKASVLMNCSGKHAAMLLTCVVNDWPTETYLEPNHPLQQAITATFERMTGEPVAHVAVDGCGAPLLATSLTGLARGLSRLATGEVVSTGSTTVGSSTTGEGSATGEGATTGEGSAAQTIAETIRQHPEHVSGTRRDEAKLLRAVTGAIGKAGAESCYVVALPDGRAFATKTDDGAARARPVLMAALLEAHGVTAEEGVDADAVRRTGESTLLGGGKPVGEVRAVLA